MRREQKRTVSPKMVKLEDVKSNDLFAIPCNGKLIIGKFVMDVNPGYQRGFVYVQRVAYQHDQALIADVVTGKHYAIALTLVGDDYYCMAGNHRTAMRADRGFLMEAKIKCENRAEELGEELRQVIERQRAYEALLKG